jgi:CBS domain-containing protein
MRKNVIVVNEKETVAKASSLMRDKGEGCAIVLRNGFHFGIITERDVTWKVAGEGLDPNKIKISSVMSSPLITIDPDSDLSEAAKLMQVHKIRRIVTKKGDTYGILTAIDVARNLEGYVEEEVRKILRYCFFSPMHG